MFLGILTLILAYANREKIYILDPPPVPLARLDFVCKALSFIPIILYCTSFYSILFYEFPIHLEKIKAIPVIFLITFFEELGINGVALSYIGRRKLGMLVATLLYFAQAYKYTRDPLHSLAYAFIGTCRSLLSTRSSIVQLTTYSAVPCIYAFLL